MISSIYGLTVERDLKIQLGADIIKKFYVISPYLLDGSAPWMLGVLKSKRGEGGRGT